MAEPTFEAFMARYNPDGTHPVIKVTAADAGRDTSPFIVVQFGPYTAVINPLGVGGQLDIDIHPFANGKDAAAGVFGMTEGKRHDAFTDADTNLRSGKWPAVRLVTVIVGEQGIVPAAGNPGELWEDRVRDASGLPPRITSPAPYSLAPPAWDVKTRVQFYSLADSGDAAIRTLTDRLTGAGYRVSGAPDSPYVSGDGHGGWYATVTVAATLRAGYASVALENLRVSLTAHSFRVLGAVKPDDAVLATPGFEVTELP